MHFQSIFYTIYGVTETGNTNQIVLFVYFMTMLVLALPWVLWNIAKVYHEDGRLLVVVNRVCMIVRHVISVVVVVMSLLNYIPALQIWHARMTRPFL